MPLNVVQQDDDVFLWIKAVPGASRDKVAGLIGYRLKVRISAPAEGGKANASICKVIAKALDVKPSRVSIESGGTNPEKIVRIRAMTSAEVMAKLGLSENMPESD